MFGPRKEASAAASEWVPPRRDRLDARGCELDDAGLPTGRRFVNWDKAKPGYRPMPEQPAEYQIWSDPSPRPGEPGCVTDEAGEKVTFQMGNHNASTPLRDRQMLAAAKMLGTKGDIKRELARLDSTLTKEARFAFNGNYRAILDRLRWIDKELDAIEVSLCNRGDAEGAKLLSRMRTRSEEVAA